MAYIILAGGDGGCVPVVVRVRGAVGGAAREGCVWWEGGREGATGGGCELNIYLCVRCRCPIFQRQTMSELGARESKI